jgi:carbon starvation protein
VWLLAVTTTAGIQKIWHSDPRIGFLAQAMVLEEKTPGLAAALAAAQAGGDVNMIAAAGKALHTNRVLHFNNILDAIVAGSFLALVAVIVLLSVREWILLLARRKLAVLRETEPVWLPDYAVAEAKPLQVMGLLALAFAIGKELSGEAQMERARQAEAVCNCASEQEPRPANASGRLRNRLTDGRLYAQVMEQQSKGVRRCC